MKNMNAMSPDEWDQHVLDVVRDEKHPLLKAIYEICKARHMIKRQAGCRRFRPDGTPWRLFQDFYGALCEWIAATILWLEWNTDVLTFGCDGGFDLKIRLPADNWIARLGLPGVWPIPNDPAHVLVGAGVRWLGDRNDGKLILNYPLEKDGKRNVQFSKSELFISIGGNLQDGFRMFGWATRVEMAATPPDSLNGAASVCHSFPVVKIHEPQELIDLMPDKPVHGLNLKSREGISAFLAVAERNPRFAALRKALLSGAGRPLPGACVTQAAMEPIIVSGPASTEAWEPL
jgi:hypothetical protein